MRGEEGHVWKTVLRTVVAVQLQISHTSVVCVRKRTDESKTLIGTDVSPLARNIQNCDLVCHLEASSDGWLPVKVKVKVCMMCVCDMCGCCYK